MIEKTSLGERIHKYKYFGHVAAAMVVGLVLIYVATRFKAHATTHDVLREFGIAIVIASIVTLMYETYAREVLAQETMAKVVESVMGDMFDAQLWEEMRRQLLQKTVVRREGIVRLSLEPHAKLSNGQTVLWVSLTYRVHELRTKSKTIHIRHSLDTFMTRKDLDLPRFTRIQIGDRVLDPRTLIEGRLDIDSPADSSRYGTNVLIERREIVHLPGAYHLIMSELTFLEQIFIQDVPDDVAVTVNWTLDPAQAVPANNGCKIKRLLMPGHAIEVRFSKNEAMPKDAAA
jgi:hypothetical protein